MQTTAFKLLSFIGTQRPKEPTRMNLEDQIYWLSRDLNECEKNEKVRILSRDLYHILYNNKKVNDALEYAIYQQKANIRVICGPAISIDNKGKNSLLDSAIYDRGKIELYSNDTFFEDPKFRVIGDRYLFTESNFSNKSLYFYGTSGISKSEIKSHIDKFDSLIELLGIKKINKDNKNELLMVTDEDVIAINDSIKSNDVIGLKYYKLDRNDMKVIYNKVHKEKNFGERVMEYKFLRETNLTREHFDAYKYLFNRRKDTLVIHGFTSRSQLSEYLRKDKVKEQKILEDLEQTKLIKRYRPDDIDKEILLINENSIEFVKRIF